ncbi:MAG: MerR family transcriptional regulator [Bacteroidales bacterium]|nr:MerR family transcriptional regulator [Bacteroidales bacterium]
MSERNLLKIGEFSQLMHVTIKALRHYEAKGLLRPENVDPWTGYRYYTVRQMQQLAEIRRMQHLGLTIGEIKELMDEQASAPDLALIDAKIVDVERQIRALIVRHRHLMAWRDSRKQLQNMDTFTIQPLPAINVAYHREIISGYDALGPLCCEHIGPAMLRTGCVCTEPGYCFTIDHSGECRQDNIDIEYCEQVETLLPNTSYIQFKRLPAVPRALCVKHVGPYERFSETFTRALRYMDDHGLRLAGDPRYSYIDGAWNQPDPEQWLSVLQIPVE